MAAVFPQGKQPKFSMGQIPLGQYNTVVLNELLLPCYLRWQKCVYLSVIIESFEILESVGDLTCTWGLGRGGSAQLEFQQLAPKSVSHIRVENWLLLMRMEVLTSNIDDMYFGHHILTLTNWATVKKKSFWCFLHLSTGVSVVFLSQDQVRQHIERDYAAFYF